MQLFFLLDSNSTGTIMLPTRRTGCPIQIDRQHHESLGEFKIKTTVRLPRGWLSLKDAHPRCWQGCRTTGPLKLLGSACEGVQPLWKPIGKFLKKLYLSLLCNEGFSCQEFTHEKWKHKYAKTGRCIFTAALFVIATQQKQTKRPSVNRQTNSGTSMQRMQCIIHQQ